MSVSVRRIARTTLVCCLLPAVYACDKKGGSNDSAEEAKEEPKSAEVASYAWRADSKASYAVSILTSYQAADSPVPQILGVKGVLSAYFSATGQTLRALVELQRVQIVDANGKTVGGIESLRRELLVPFGLEFKEGQLVAYYDGPGQTHQSAGYRGLLAAALQLPERNARTPFREDEWDATGRAEVQYRRIGEGEYSWKKLAYREVILDTPKQAQGVSTEELKPTIKSSDGTLVFDEAGLQSLDKKDNVRVPLAKGKAIRSSTTLKMKRTPTVPSDIGD